MKFDIPKYNAPDFTKEIFVNAPNVKLEVVEKEGVSPSNYHALSVFPEYFKVNGKWILATQSRMDSACVVNDEPGKESLKIVELRNLNVGDKVAIGRAEDASEGIYVYDKGFESKEKGHETFAFRSGRSRETAFSIDYEKLYDVLRNEKEKNGYVTWVLGTAISLDRDTRSALENLVREGFVNSIICGTSLAAFDLECGIFDTIWGQEVFVKEQQTMKNYYSTINMAREAGSVEALVKSGKVKDGIIKACVDCNVPFVLSGTIRDRFTLPGTYNDVTEAQDAMRKHARKTSTIIMVSTALFTIATGNMTASYNEFDGVIRPVYMYTVDIQEFAVNKLADRGTLTATSIVTNTQDFIKHVGRALT